MFKAAVLDFHRDCTGQTATEYLMLVAVSLAIVLVGVGVALELKSLSDVVLFRVGSQRNSTLAMLVR